MEQIVRTFFPDGDYGLQKNIEEYLARGYFVVLITQFTASDGLAGYTVIFQKKQEG